MAKTFHFNVDYPSEKTAILLSKKQDVKKCKFSFDAREMVLFVEVLDEEK